MARTRFWWNRNNIKRTKAISNVKETKGSRTSSVTPFLVRLCFFFFDLYAQRSPLSQGFWYYDLYMEYYIRGMRYDRVFSIILVKESILKIYIGSYTNIITIYVNVKYFVIIKYHYWIPNCFQTNRKNWQFAQHITRALYTFKDIKSTCTSQQNSAFENYR